MAEEIEKSKPTEESTIAKIAEKIHHHDSSSSSESEYKKLDSPSAVKAKIVCSAERCLSTRFSVVENSGPTLVTGARVVISHPQGREGLKQQRKEFSDVVISDLPDDSTLRNVAKKHSFELTQFFYEQGLYLAVLKFSNQ